MGINTFMHTKTRQKTASAACGHQVRLNLGNGGCTMIETALLFFMASALIFLSLVAMSSLRKGKKTYGAGNWPQPITETPKMTTKTEGWDG
jgi:hypothetical protein